jgi:hypothetical protein
MAASRIEPKSGGPVAQGADSITVDSHTRFELLSPALRRNRLAPGAQLQLHLPVPPAPRPPAERPPAVWEDPIEDLVQKEIDSLIAEDLIEM